MDANLKVELVNMSKGRGRAIVLALISALAGWGLPEMGWGSGAIPWILAGCVFFIIVIIVTDDLTRKLFSLWKGKYSNWAKPILAIIICIIVPIIIYIFCNNFAIHQNDVKQLRQEADDLITKVTVFISDKMAVSQSQQALSTYIEMNDQAQWGTGFVYQGISDSVFNSVFISLYDTQIISLGYSLLDKTMIAKEEFTSMEQSLQLLQASIGADWYTLNEIKHNLELWYLKIK